MKYTLTLMISLQFFGCGQHAQVTANNNQVLFHEVIYLDKYYTHFLEAIRTDSSNRDSIYSNQIKDKIVSEHFSKTEYSDFVSGWFSKPVKNISNLPKYISDISDNRKEVETIISSAFLRCNDYLKNDSLIFYVVPALADKKEVLNEMGGVAGFTPGSQQIILQVDFNIKTWKEALKYTIAHEFNHACLIKKTPAEMREWTLLRYLVFEGKAEAFASLVYPLEKEKIPNTFSLTDNEKKALWLKIKPDLQSDNWDIFMEVMFGSKNYPHYGGYTLGFDIIQTAFKNHPEILKTNWTYLDADSFLKLSDYN
ncbi:MAG: DUF2268 domain-containing protein [Chitinophagales bacterium]|nr:DUF2268 domain-containing protein [Chitinophagales bacterium]